MVRRLTQAARERPAVAGLAVVWVALVLALSLLAAHLARATPPAEPCAMHLLSRDLDICLPG